MSILNMSNNAISYTINHLFSIINPNNSLTYEIEVNREIQYVKITFTQTQQAIICYITDDKNWNELLNNDSLELEWVSDATETSMIPILFWGIRENDVYKVTNKNEVLIYADFLSATFFMLSRWEEYYSSSSDIHGRYLYEGSVAHRHNIISIPVIDEYAMIIKKIIECELGIKDLGSNKFQIKASHDIDDIQRFKNAYYSLRSLAGEFIKEKSIYELVNGIKEWLHSRKNPIEDPYFRGIYKLADISETFNLTSAFYFQTSQKSHYNVGYAMDKNINSLITYLIMRKHEVGLHPGYETFNNKEILEEEKKRLDDILGKKHYGGRQHYLRFNVKSTWQYWNELGFSYDSTLGYAEHEGFRCGTCHPFKTYNLKEDAPNNLVEIPLIVMDVTLRDYRKYSIEEALQNTLALLCKCYKVGGTFTILWHNSSVCGNWKTWIDKVYIPLLENAITMINKGGENL